MVEAAAAGSRGRDHQPVERRAAALVLIEAVAHELAQEACALRVSEADDTLHRRCVLAQRGGRASMLQVGGEVAHGRESQPGDWRTHRTIRDFVEAGLEAGRTAERAAVRRKLPTL